MPYGHLTHFSQIKNFSELAKNYGIAFSKLSEAVSNIIADDDNFKAESESKESGIAIATYGKCTTWKEKKEHLHIKLFPFRGSVGQPYTVDSSFLRKEIHKDESGNEYVKMDPIRKSVIDKERFEELGDRLIKLLQ